MSSRPDRIAGAFWIACALASACGGKGNPQAGALRVVSFTATPASIAAGQATTLAWNVTGATAVSIDTVGTVATAGSKAVSPFTTTTFTLRAASASGTATGSATATATVTVIPAGRFSQTSRLNDPRDLAAAATLPDGKVLVVGGFAPGYVLSPYAEVFDPAGGYTGAGIFSATYPMKHARKAAAAAPLANGKVLVAGGADDFDTLGSAELFDPQSRTFTATGNLVSARSHATATPLPNGKVLIAGGIGRTPYAAAELFDPAGNGGAGAFTATASMAAARAYATATLLANGKVLIAGGYDFPDTGGVPSAYHSSAELFDPAGNGGAGSFSPTGSMATPRYSATATLLADGRVLMTGGDPFSGNGAELGIAEIYDPAGNGGAGSFTALPGARILRQAATATRLANGKVLIAAGGGRSDAPLDSAEIFDPAGNGGAGTFAWAGTLAAARSNAVAALLPDGRVLIAGGSDGQSALTSAELFTLAQ